MRVIILNLILIAFLSSCSGKDQIKTYYNDGTLQSKGYVVDGVKQGLSEVYYKTGKLKEKGLWKNGKQEGKWLFCFPSGILSAEIHFSDNDQRRGIHILP